MAQGRKISFVARSTVKHRVSFKTRAGNMVSFKARVPSKKRVTFTAYAPAHERLSQANRLVRTTEFRRNHQTPKVLTDIARALFEVELGLSVIGDLLTLVSILGIFGLFGFNSVGLFLGLCYLGVWEIVGFGLSLVETRLPRPLRFVWRIAEHIVDIVFG